MNGEDLPKFIEPVNGIKFEVPVALVAGLLQMHHLSTRDTAPEDGQMEMATELSPNGALTSASSASCHAH